MSTLRELAFAIRELRRDIDELERTQGLGTSEWLAGAKIDSHEYLWDGVWVEENDAATAHYADAGNTDRHGQPGLQQNSGAGNGREIYLRFRRPVRLPPARGLLFVFPFEQLIGNRDHLAQNLLDVTLGLITVAFSQATLEAMTWNNKLASDAGRILWTLLEDTDPTFGSDWLTNIPETPAGRGSILAVRCQVASWTTINGVRLWIPNQGGGETAEGNATMMNTRLGKPQRSLLLLE